jgi:hypothetical protein
MNHDVVSFSQGFDGLLLPEVWDRDGLQKSVGEHGKSNEFL